MSEVPTLPADCDQFLHHAVYDACTAASQLLARDVVQSAITARMGFSLVLDAVWRAYQDYARSHNEVHSSASRLPPEVLCSIFRYLPLAGRISTSHVSHFWRNASLAFVGELWSCVPHTRRLDRLALLLDRTAALGLPVDLMGVHLNAQRLVSMCELLKRHLWHIRTLILDAFCFEGQCGDIVSLLQSAAPMLHHFNLEDSPGHLARLSFQRGIFAGHAPNLERLELGTHGTLYINKFADAVAFPRIRHVRIASVRLCPSEPDEVWSVLPKFPALKSLEIWTITFHDQSGTQQEKIRPPHALERLAIRPFDAAELVAFDVQSVLKIRTVCVSPLRSGATLPSTGVVPFLLSDVDRLGLEMECIFRSKSFSVRLRQPGHQYHARTRTFLHVEPTVLFLPSFQESTFSVITSLALYISADFNPGDWPYSHIIPCLNVEHLTLAYEVWLQDDAASGFAFVGMTFPRLRTLTLLAARGPGADLDAHALVSTVPSLGYTTPTLTTLTLCGFSVRPSSEELYDIADEIRCTEEGYGSVPDVWADT